MVLPHEIYIDQLALPLRGCPLWGSMHPQEDPVDIADVGYLSDDGGWLKLFNLRTESDPKKLPSNHQPGSLVITDQDIGKDIFKGPRYSNSIRKLGGSIGVQGIAEAGLSFECAEEKGAILFVAEDAVTRNILNKVQLVTLIQENIENWMEFATRKGRDVRMSDLVLVTGYVRTTTWVATVFRQKLQGCKFKAGGVFPVEGAKLELWGSLDVNAFAWTGGPEEMKSGSPLDTTHFLKHMAPNLSPPALLCKDDPRHQCVLVRGYRMAGRHWRELLSFKKNKLLKGIDALKRNPRNPVGIIENRHPSAYQPANPGAHTVGTSQIVINANTDTAMAINTDTTIVMDTGVAMTIDAIPERVSDTIYEDESLQSLSLNNNETNVVPSESSSRGSSSNRRGRGTKRTRRRGYISARGGNHDSGRRDGGAGAGSSSGSSSGNSNMGSQSSSGGTANSGGQSGTCNTGQRGGGTSGNVMDAIELDQNVPEHGYRSGLVTDNIKGEFESEVASESESECSEDSVEVAFSPWDIFLEYLLQTEKKASYAILHDDDFSIIEPMEVKSVSELRAQLQVLRPRVYLNGTVGMLKPTALEFFRSTGYFFHTDPEGLMAYFSKDTPSNTTGFPGPNHVHMFSDFQENPEILFATLKKIYIHARAYIYSIQCEYQGPEGKILLGNEHGNSGDAPLYVFELNSDEYIVKVRGRSGAYIEQLQFLTNQGRISSTYGGSGGKPFVWTVDAQRYPNSPGLHHFEGTYENYIRTLKASFPIYPWFEDGTQTAVSESKTESDSGGLTTVELNISTMFTIEKVYDIVIFSETDTKNVQHIRVDVASKLLRETESQVHVCHRLGKLFGMLESSVPSAIHCASVVIAELARLGRFELEIKNMLLNNIRYLLENKDRYILLHKLSKQEVFKKEIISLLPDLVELLKCHNASVQWNASVLLSHLSAQRMFQTSFQGVLKNIIDLLNGEDDSAAWILLELLMNLAEQAQFQPSIIRVLPNIIGFLRNHSPWIQTSAANAIRRLVDREEFRPFFKEHTTVIIQSLTGLMNDFNLSIQLSGVNTLLKLSQKGEFHSAIVENLSNFANLFENEHLSVRTNGIALLGELADCAAFTTEILHLLRPDILTPSKPYNPSIWVNVLAVSSTMLNRLKHDEKLDSYIYQLIGTLEDDNENIRNNSADVLGKLLRYVKDPSLVYRLLDLTTSSEICRLNGVNALLVILDDETHGNTISAVIGQTIPNLVGMLRSDNWERAVSVLRKISERSEFRQEIIRIIPKIMQLLQQSTHSLSIRLAGIELLTAFAEYAEFRPTIANDLSYLLTLLNDQDASVELAGSSLLEALSTDGTLVVLMAPLAIPLIKKLFLRKGPDMYHKGIAILLNISKQGEHKNSVVNMIKEVVLDIANSFIRTEPLAPYFSLAEHILEPGSSSPEGALSTRYVTGSESKLLRLFSEQVEFQNPILEATPIFVEAAKEPNDTSVYDILKILSVHGGLQSAIEPVIPFVVDMIESNGRHLQACLDLLWTLSEQAVYRSSILPFASRLASLMKANSSTPDVPVTMAGVLMNLRTVSSDTDKPEPWEMIARPADSRSPVAYHIPSRTSNYPSYSNATLVANQFITDKGTSVVAPVQASVKGKLSELLGKDTIHFLDSASGGSKYPRSQPNPGYTVSSPSKAPYSTSYSNDRINSGASPVHEGRGMRYRPPSINSIASNFSSLSTSTYVHRSNIYEGHEGPDRELDSYDDGRDGFDDADITTIPDAYDETDRFGDFYDESDPSDTRFLYHDTSTIENALPFYVLAVYDFLEGDPESMLLFQKGDILEIISVQPSGWWAAQALDDQSENVLGVGPLAQPQEERVGWIPSAFVNVVPTHLVQRLKDTASQSRVVEYEKAELFVNSPEDIDSLIQTWGLDFDAPPAGDGGEYDEQERSIRGIVEETLQMRVQSPHVYSRTHTHAPAGPRMRPLPLPPINEDGTPPQPDALLPVVVKAPSLSTIATLGPNASKIISPIQPPPVTPVPPNVPAPAPFNLSRWSTLRQLERDLPPSLFPPETPLPPIPEVAEHESEEHHSKPRQRPDFHQHRRTASSSTVTTVGSNTTNATVGTHLPNRGHNARVLSTLPTSPVSAKLRAAFPPAAMAGGKNDKMRQLLGDDDAQAFHNAKQALATLPWYLKPQRDVDSGEIRLEHDGSIRYGSVEALVERLTLPFLKSDLEKRFRHVFLLTFHSFTTAERILELLIEKFEMDSPPGLNVDEFTEWKDKKLRPTQARVLRVLTVWVDNYDLIQDDPRVIPRLQDFLELIHSPPQHAQNARLILQNIANKRWTDINLPALESVAATRRPAKSSKTKTDILRIEPGELARHLTLYEARLYLKIHPHECFKFAASQKLEGLNNLRAFISTSDKIASWVKLSVLKNDPLGKRADVIHLWIRVAERCRALNNFSSTVAIIAALTSQVIARLQLTWAHVSRTSRIDPLVKIFETTNNFASYRNTLMMVDGPCVPYIGTFLSDMVKISEGLPDPPKLVVPVSDSGSSSGGSTSNAPSTPSTANQQTREIKLISFSKYTKMEDAAQMILKFQPKVRDDYKLVELVSTMQFVESQLNLAATKNEDEFWARSNELQRYELAHVDIKLGLEQGGV